MALAIDVRDSQFSGRSRAPLLLFALITRCVSCIVVALIDVAIFATWPRMFGFPQASSMFRPSAQHRAACHRRSTLSKVGSSMRTIPILYFGQGASPQGECVPPRAKVATIFIILAQHRDSPIRYFFEQRAQRPQWYGICISSSRGYFFISPTNSWYPPDVIPALRMPRNNSSRVSDSIALTRGLPQSRDRIGFVAILISFVNTRGVLIAWRMFFTASFASPASPSKYDSERSPFYQDAERDCLAKILLIYEGIPILHI